jgi:hypothetical protein
MLTLGWILWCGWGVWQMGYDFTWTHHHPDHDLPAGPTWLTIAMAACLLVLFLLTLRYTQPDDNWDARRRYH